MRSSPSIIPASNEDRDISLVKACASDGRDIPAALEDFVRLGDLLRYIATISQSTLCSTTSGDWVVHGEKLTRKAPTDTRSSRTFSKANTTARFG